MPSIVKWMAATLPASIVPFAVSSGTSVIHLSHVVVIRSSSMPTAAAIIGTVAPQASTSMSVCSRIGVKCGGRPMPISSS